MRRLIWGFAGCTYHIVGNLMLRLKSQNISGKRKRKWQKEYRCPSDKPKGQTVRRKMPVMTSVVTDMIIYLHVFIVYNILIKPYLVDYCTILFEVGRQALWIAFTLRFSIVIFKEYWKSFDKREKCSIHDYTVMSVMLRNGVRCLVEYLPSLKPYK